MVQIWRNVTWDLRAQMRPAAYRLAKGFAQPPLHCIERFEWTGRKALGFCQRHLSYPSRDQEWFTEFWDLPNNRAAFEQLSSFRPEWKVQVATSYSGSNLIVFPCFYTISGLRYRQAIFCGLRPGVEGLGFGAHLILAVAYPNLKLRSQLIVWMQVDRQFDRKVEL